MDDRQHLSLERRLYIMSETIRLVEKSFIHWEDASFEPSELGTIAETFFKKAAEAHTRGEFQKVMWELLGLLRNAHCWYSDRLAPEPAHGYLSFAIWEIDGECVVRKDVADFLQPGDIVRAIDGKPMTRWWQELSRYSAVANPVSQHIRNRQFLNLFIERDSVEVEIVNQEEEIRKVTIPLLPGRDERFLAFAPPAQTEGEWLREGKTAYIRIPSFEQPKYEQRALELIDEYKHADALIIDVRGNGGGSTPGELTKRLMDRPYRWWQERARHPEHLWIRHGGNGELQFADDYRYAEFQPNWTEPSSDHDPFEGKVVLLANRYTGSAAEDFIMPFKDNGRATIVGERTWGSTGQPVFKQFGEDISIAIGSIRAYMPDGTSFEGIGIDPDIEVAYMRDHIRSGQDVVLDRALELLTVIS